MKKTEKIRQLSVIILIMAGLLLSGCQKYTEDADSDFNEFVQSDSDFFTIARTIMPWNDDIPSDASMVYRHKSMSDGREYAEIQIKYSDSSNTIVQAAAERKTQIFAQTHVGQMPYFCIEEETFRINGTVFQCYSFSISKSNHEPADYYGFALGYNTEENSVVYLFFSDEDLSFSEPDYLLKRFYP